METWPCQQGLKVSIRLLDFGELEKNSAWIECKIFVEHARHVAKI